MPEPRATGPLSPARRRLLRGALLLGAMALAPGLATARAQDAASPIGRSEVDAQRARIAFGALQERFFLSDAALYRDFKQTHPKLAFPYASNWSFSVAARASLALATSPVGADLPADPRRLVGEGLERYWDPAGNAYNSELQPPLGIPFGPDCYRFYDDNAHDGLLLLEYAEATGEAWALARARALFDFIIGGVDAQNPVMTGGIRWAQTPERAPKQDRNMTSNAPGALLGFALYLRTGERRCYDWAAGMLAWCNAYLRDKADGLYWDKVRADGTIDPTKWSYNQGFMIGVYTKLSELLGDRRYLAEAERIARAALSFHGRFSRNGITGLLNQDPDFNAILFRYLTRLLPLSADAELRETAQQAMRAYGEQVWNSPVYHQPGDILAPPGDSSPLRMQAGMVEIYTLLAG